MESLKWIMRYLKKHILKYSIALILVLITSLTLGDLVIFNRLIWALNNPMRMAGYLINNTERFIASSIKLNILIFFRCIF